jgi:hypothetical protein
MASDANSKISKQPKKTTKLNLWNGHPTFPSYLCILLDAATSQIPFCHVVNLYFLAHSYTIPNVYFFHHGKAEFHYLIDSNNRQEFVTKER